MPPRHVPTGLPPTLASVNRTLVMAVLNVTPDSFSDGGLYLDADRAVQRAVHQMQLGADLIDVGGESTRPGAERIAVSDELTRVIPVIEALVREECAGHHRHDARRGGTRCGDGWGRRGERRLGWAGRRRRCFRSSLSSGVPVVLMHWRGHSAEMHLRSHYPGGVVQEVVR